MNLFQPYLYLLIFLSITATSIATDPKYAKTGCKDTCGNNVTIPYPFGIGKDCSVNLWYVVDCNSSKPYPSALNHLEVLRVDLGNQTVTVNTPRISDCRNQGKITSLYLRGNPFLFCSYRNRFVFDGCGNAVMTDNGNVVTGCSNSCLNESTVIERNDCFGFSCCQTTIPYYLESYSINLMGLGEDGGCGYAFLVDDDSYLKGSFSVQSVTDSVPVALMWTLPRSTTLNCCRRAADRMNVELYLGNSISVESQKCSRRIGYKGNPYLYDGCEGKRTEGSMVDEIEVNQTPSIVFKRRKSPRIAVMKAFSKFKNTASNPIDLTKEAEKNEIMKNDATNIIEITSGRTHNNNLGKRMSVKDKLNIINVESRSIKKNNDIKSNNEAVDESRLDLLSNLTFTGNC